MRQLASNKLALLQELNINTVEDLVLYLPTRYEDNTVVDLNMAEDQSTVTVLSSYRVGR
jgi:ATP-dependent DNA helicase RecG